MNLPAPIKKDLDRAALNVLIWKDLEDDSRNTGRKLDQLKSRLEVVARQRGLK